MKKNYKYLLISGLILLGAVIARFYDLPNRAIFTEDHALFSIFAYKNIIYHERLVCGPSIGGVWATFPPTFYYLTTWLDKITNFDYLVFHRTTAIANIVAILLMILLLPKLLGKRIALVTVFLYSFSFFVVSQAIVGTNPGLVPPLAFILSSSVIFYLRDKKWWLLPFTALSLSVMTHLHTTAFFLIPGLFIIFLFNWKRIDISKKGLLALGLTGLIILFVGIRPHYLQNKAFGNQNIKLVENAIFNGPKGSALSKAVSVGNFSLGLFAINNDILFPNKDGYQDQTVTAFPMVILGTLITLTIVGFAVWKAVKGLTKPTAVAIFATMFLSNLIFQALVPSYMGVTKPIRWLDAVYLPSFFVLLATFVNAIATNIKKLVTQYLIFGVIGTTFLFFNTVKWITDDQTEGRLKLKTIIAKAQITAKFSADEKNINLMHLGNVNLNPTWPFAFTLWKETGNDKYLRTLLWNIDPKQNEPFYIFSDKDDNTRKLSETIANSYQDNPANLKIDLEDGFLVEKIYNSSN